MKKIVKVMLVVIAVIILLGALLIRKAASDWKKYAQDQERMSKSDEQLIGTHLYLPRENGTTVDVNLYTPESETPMPLVVNLHGGAFIAGDADMLDTQSDRISREWNLAVVSVNYTLMKDGIAKQYAVDEIKDTVKYFIDHAKEYHVDPEKIFLLGYSAGGCHAMSCAIQLHQEGITVAGQILCYAYLGDTLEQFSLLISEQQGQLAPALFVLAGDEPIGNSSLEYKDALDQAGVETVAIVYDNAIHGFIEENNPEYEQLNIKGSKSPEQEVLARQAENEIGKWIKGNCDTDNG